MSGRWRRLPDELWCGPTRGGFVEAIRELVLDDQRSRNHICWSVFDC